MSQHESAPCRHVTRWHRVQLLGEQGARLGLSTPRQFFWVTGALSSFLDNTPTYVALSAAASSLLGTDPQVRWRPACTSSQVLCACTCEGYE